MKRTLLFLILILIFSSTNATATIWTPEAFEIPYQINHSNRIITGTVTDIQQYYDRTEVAIEVDEWLMGPLPLEEITVITEIGKFSERIGEPKFTENETVLLMLKDADVSDNRFKVLYGEPGKHLLSDKDIILRELDHKNKTTEFVLANEATLESESKNETDEEIPSNEIPFIGLAGMSIAVSGAFLLLRKYD
ncbi:hypothetical protein [Methanococcoides seepicolus]|uniref:S-layer family duplication domain-containing protein n=1 Tax=Methanococcoides seepicolus TaxID=2828780 RepID=A0A9E4ZFT4_9EURY|nr:hypothetical protein [Methanococcoides seepicolus]MCM1986840.1 hypothetical protein [Methanococcoides seepicolus]